MAIWIMVSLLAGRSSSSLLNRRYRPSQAKVRSTTQRRGRTAKPRGRIVNRLNQHGDGVAAELWFRHHKPRAVPDGVINVAPNVEPAVIHFCDPDNLAGRQGAKTVGVAGVGWCASHRRLLFALSHEYTEPHVFRRRRHCRHQNARCEQRWRRGKVGPVGRDQRAVDPELH